LVFLLSGAVFLYELNMNGHRAALYKNCQNVVNLEYTYEQPHQNDNAQRFPNQSLFLSLFVFLFPYQALFLRYL